MTDLTPDLAASFARSTLGHLTREYPSKLDHVMTGPQDALTPAALHPVFYGSYDWHSCVHGWWQVMRIARLYPDLPESAQARALADAMLVPDKVAGECAYLDRPGAAGFERPYGWGWLLALHGELQRHDAPWAAALEPLANAFAARFHAYLPKLTYAVRVGTHYNTAFALILARAWASNNDPALVTLIDGRVRHWFARDRDCQAWEPSGDDFLSSALTEAHLMALVTGADFAAWFDAFLPDLRTGSPATLFTPATVSDRSDGKTAHLDGLNLSRAWCWRRIGAALGQDHPVHGLCGELAQRHLAAGLPHLASDYMGEHWLASFALLALDG